MDENVMIRGDGAGAREEEEEEEEKDGTGGLQPKNKNPTPRCGEKTFLRTLGGCCWGARWLCFVGLLFLILSFRVFLPKVASHGVDVVCDSCLKTTYLRVSLTVLRHSRISH